MLAIKNSKPIFYGLVVVSTLAMGATRASSVMGATPTSPAGDESQGSPAKNGIISKSQYTPGSYCHQRFPAISRSTLGTDHPQIPNVQSGDMINY
jgi:hypothetical protein